MHNCSILYFETTFKKGVIKIYTDNKREQINETCSIEIFAKASI